MPKLNHTVCIRNPSFDGLGYVIATANINDKHDRSTPSDHHWKILKCRMIIFSSTVLASPDKNEVKRVHIIFNKMGNEYDQLNSLFIKFSLTQEGEIRQVNTETFETCFEYTLTAKLAPVWNKLGYHYLVNNRDFLTTAGFNDGVQYKITVDENETNIELSAVKINLARTVGLFDNNECIRVLPSLTKAVVEKYIENLPENGMFKSYKDLRRHWKNIHGYRLPEEEVGGYYSIRFWRGKPLTYPALCTLQRFPIITPVTKSYGEKIIDNLINQITAKIQLFGKPLITNRTINEHPNKNITKKGTDFQCKNSEIMDNTQAAVSLCTPTQNSIRSNKTS